MNIAPHYPCAVRRRGSVYLLVLSMSIIIVVIGVSASYMARVRSASSKLIEDSSHARLLGQSAVEIVIKRLDLDPAWRTNHVSGVWTSPPETIGDGNFVYMLQDERDGVINDTNNSDVRLHIRATRSGAVRLYSAMLEPTPVLVNPNLLANPGFESGTTSWTNNWSTLSIETGDVSWGSQALHVSARLSSLAGPKQVVTSGVAGNTTYDVGFAIKVLGASRRVRAEISAVTTSFANYADKTVWITVPANTWTKVSSTIQTTWSGPIFVAELKIYTDVGTEVLLLDETLLQAQPGPPIMRVASGSWAREVLP